MAKIYRPAILSTPVLAILALISVGLLYWSISSRREIKQRYFDEKLEASLLMQRSMSVLKNHRLKGGVGYDLVNDPNQTGLIGEKYSIITTDAGNLEAKLTTTNPNFAALMIQLLHEADVKKSDKVAVAFTGSMPTANIAVLAALKVMEVKPVIITSLGASMWGANDPDFTWLDMERVLGDSGLIDFKSAAASLGGGSDIGRRLSRMGRNSLNDAIDRNGVGLIHEKDLEANILRRLKLYNAVLSENESFAAYLNIGGGYASIGHSINGRLIPSGVVKNLMVREYQSNGVILEFGRRGIPIIHVLNILELADKYGLEKAPVPLPEPGVGALFIEERYNLTVCWISLLLVLGLLAAIIIQIKRKVRFVQLEKDNEITL